MTSQDPEAEGAGNLQSTANVLPRSSCLRPTASRRVCEAECSRTERAHGWKSGGSLAETSPSPLTLGCSICKDEMNTCSTVTKHVEGHGVLASNTEDSGSSGGGAASAPPAPAPPGLWVVVRSWGPTCKTLLLLTWSPISVSLKTQTLLTPGSAPGSHSPVSSQASPYCDPLPSHTAVMISVSWDSHLPGSWEQQKAGTSSFSSQKSAQCNEASEIRKTNSIFMKQERLWECHPDDGDPVGQGERGSPSSGAFFCSLQKRTCKIHFWKVRSPPWDVKPKLYDCKSRSRVAGVDPGESLDLTPWSRQGSVRPRVTQTSRVAETRSISVTVGRRDALPCESPPRCLPSLAEEKEGPSHAYTKPCVLQETLGARNAAPPSPHRPRAQSWFRAELPSLGVSLWKGTGPGFIAKTQEKRRKERGKTSSRWRRINRKMFSQGWINCD